MDAIAPSPIHQRLDTLASTDIQEFKQFFRRLHKLFPEQAAEACLLYIASHGLDAAAKSMAYWLVGDATYVNILLDPEGLTPENAGKAIAVVKEVDPQFLFRFVKGIAALKTPAAILRSMGFLPPLGDYSIFIPWLRSLSQNIDVRVRSRAAKLLCELRPNKGLIDRQMQSPDARVRASAIEALWQAPPREETRSMLQAALTDSHHRVVSNALVGLHRLGEKNAFQGMVQFASHEDHLFRAASAWALGFVGDLGGIPVLQDMTRDESMVVRKRALKSLLLLESLKPAEPEMKIQQAAVDATQPADAQTVQLEPPTVTPEPPPAAPEPVETEIPADEQVGVKMFLFR